MIGAAAGDGWKKQTHRLLKRDIRQGHRGTQILKDVLDEIAAIWFMVDTISSRGKPARKRVQIVTTVEEKDESDDAWIEFEFTDDTRRLLGSSEVYGSLNRLALLSFQSKYSVTLYELGCLYAGRREPTVTFTVPELRGKLGVPEGKYRDWTDLAKRVIEPAKAELDLLSHFQVSIQLQRSGRKVVRVTLGFWRKDDDAIEAAAAELERPRAQQAKRAKEYRDADQAARKKLREQVALDRPKPNNTAIEDLDPADRALIEIPDSELTDTQRDRKRQLIGNGLA